ncbi:hypothetical protein ACFFIX_20110 [Metabacillus herbersteinensis]|uniref:DUF805 domain-containing protein n=1 Tax=Metabacillus herbersteinensis TaxID=283816 RepID=A0ABV6GJ16_9BACI
MLKQIRALEDKQLLRGLWWNTGTFAVVFLLLCYLDGDHDYVSFQTAVVILIVVYIPGLLLMLAMYVKADAETSRNRCLAPIPAQILWQSFRMLP